MARGNYTTIIILSVIAGGVVVLCAIEGLHLSDERAARREQEKREQLKHDRKLTRDAIAATFAQRERQVSEAWKSLTSEEEQQIYSLAPEKRKHAVKLMMFSQMTEEARKVWAFGIYLLLSDSLASESEIPKLCAEGGEILVYASEPRAFEYSELREAIQNRSGGENAHAKGGDSN